MTLSRRTVVKIGLGAGAMLLLACAPRLGQGSDPEVEGQGHCKMAA